MFANMTYDDKVAFFDLLDEYFALRPNLFSSGASSPTNVLSPQPTSSSNRSLPPAAPVSGGRTMPPLPSSSSSASRGPPSPTNSTTGAGAGAGGGGGLPGGFSFGARPGEKPDLATRMVLGSLKMGASGASKGLGYLSKNQQAMDAIGRAGATAMVSSAQQGLNRQAGNPQQGQGQEEQASPTAVSPPPQRTAGPPPSRAPPARKPTAPAADIQAQALYDYDASDSNDLGVQTGQVVYVVQKTSDDWWTCEDANGRKGLIPSSYLKEL